VLLATRQQLIDLQIAERLGRVSDSSENPFFVTQKKIVADSAAPHNGATSK